MALTISEKRTNNSSNSQNAPYWTIYTFTSIGTKLALSFYTGKAVSHFLYDGKDVIQCTK